MDIMDMEIPSSFITTIIRPKNIAEMRIYTEKDPVVLALQIQEITDHEPVMTYTAQVILG
jgi:hypothetical protein